MSNIFHCAHAKPPKLASTDYITPQQINESNSIIEYNNFKIKIDLIYFFLQNSCHLLVPNMATLNYSIAE